MTDTHEHHEHQAPISYEAAVRRFRVDKDAFFGSSHASPIPAGERATFTGLPYYPVDPALRFEDLTLEPYTGDEPARFAMLTSDGQLRPAARAGVLRFPFEGADRTLTAYTFEGDEGDEGGELFVPFADATSGSETYGAGRYLDVEPEEDGTYVLDFNLAYHPYCVYNENYSCPLTPAENRLPIRIEAGERLPEDPGAH